MMAVVMARLMVECAAFLFACIGCPFVWLHDGGSKAAAMLFVCYVVAHMAAPTAEDKAAFERFTKGRIAS